MGKAPCCEKMGLKRGRWTAEEDEKLANYIATNGEGSWRSLPKNAGLLRCGKSCRLRWINYLRNDLKRGNITTQEEELIVNLHATLGNRWSTIAGHLPGRTDNEIKNYWISHLSRRICSFRKADSKEKESIVTVLLDKIPGKGKGKGRRKGTGRTPRSSMEKNNSLNSLDSSSIAVPSSHASSIIVQSDQEGSHNTLMLQLDPTGPCLAAQDPTTPIIWGASEEESLGVLMSPPRPREEEEEERDGSGAHGANNGQVGPMASAAATLAWYLEGIEALLWSDEDGDGLKSQQIDQSLASWLLSDVVLRVE